MEKELILILPWHWLQPVVLVGRGRSRGRIYRLKSRRCGFLWCPSRGEGRGWWERIIDEKFARVLKVEIEEEPPGNARRKQGETTSSRSAENREELPLLELGSQAGPGEDR